MPGCTGGAVSSQLEANAERGREWNIPSVRGGVAALSFDALPVLSLFCAAYAHLLTVVDDREFHGRQVGHTTHGCTAVQLYSCTDVDSGFWDSGFGYEMLDSGFRVFWFWVLLQRGVLE